MTHQSTSFTKALFLTACLVLGCSKGGATGCNGSSESPTDTGDSTAASSTSSSGTSGDGPTVDSRRLGVYKITGFQSSEGGCDQLTEVAKKPLYLALYSFRPNSNPDEARLGGSFCGDVGSCRAAARGAAEPAIGYSFVEGDDASGWRGWAIADVGATEDKQCRADVQSHALTSVAAKTIRIETRTVEAVFEPTVEEGLATCRHKDAISSATDDLPCKGLLVLEGELEVGL